MSSIAEFRKRSLKLRSRLKKNLQKNTNQEYIARLQEEKIKLSFAVDKWCYIIRDFLTTQECTSFIEYLHKNASQQPVQRKPVTKKKENTVKRPRGLNWTINKAESIATLVYDRLYAFLPKMWMDEQDGSVWQLSGINHDLKSLKYGAGDVLCPHFDTPYIKNENERTFITAVLYLNDEFVGGQLQFVNPDNVNMIHGVQIKQGSCMLFQHNTFHQGSEIEDGIKYMIRFDILFQKLVFEAKVHKSESCVWL